MKQLLEYTLSLLFVVLMVMAAAILSALPFAFGVLILRGLGVL